MKKHIKANELNKVKELDLLTYLKNYEPDELVKISRNEYGTKSHSSLKISRGMWTWWAHNVGGKSALDYFVKVRGYEFLEAALYLQRCMKEKEPMLISNVVTTTADKIFKLPTQNGNNENIINYLCKERCIDEEIVEQCIAHYDIYESKIDHAVVFVGYDKENKARYGMQRSIYTDEKKEIYGSDKRYCFSFTSKVNSNVVHVFESAIDLLSYATLQKGKGESWSNDNYLSIGGATLIGDNGTQIPIALNEFLSNQPSVCEVHLHLDNDYVGIKTSENIKNALSEHYECILQNYSGVKDINEYLQNKVANKAKGKER